MASENVEIVRTAFGHFDRREIDEFVAMVDDDVDWRVSGYLTGESNVRGREAVRGWLEKLATVVAAGSDVQLVQDEYRDLDEHTVLVLGFGRIEREHDPLEEQLGWIWRIEGGRIVMMEDFLSHEEALEAAKEYEEG